MSEICEYLRDDAMILKLVPQLWVGFGGNGLIGGIGSIDQEGSKAFVNLLRRWGLARWRWRWEAVRSPWRRRGCLACWSETNRAGGAEVL